MNSSSPTKITIDSLRGATNPFTVNFEKGKKLTVIYGENGTGKSTICDGLELIGNGKIGSLENRGLGKLNRYWHSLGKSASDVSVTLETATVACRATVGKNGEVSTNPPDHCPRVEILRRMQILSLVATTGAELYSAIKRFIDVSGIEASEDALRGLIKDMTGSLDTVATSVQSNRKAIENFWQEAGQQQGDPIARARAESARDPHEFEADINALDEIRMAYERMNGCLGDLTTANAQLEVILDELDDALTTLEEQRSKISANATEFVALLESAKAYLKNDPSLSACPLCESTENATGLANRIDQRLSDFMPFSRRKPKERGWRATRIAPTNGWRTFIPVRPSTRLNSRPVDQNTNGRLIWICRRALRLCSPSSWRIGLAPQLTCLRAGSKCWPNSRTRSNFWVR
jgi:hypothetical protein